MLKMPIFKNRRQQNCSGIPKEFSAELWSEKQTSSAVNLSLVELGNKELFGRAKIVP